LAYEKTYPDGTKDILTPFLQDKEPTDKNEEMKNNQSKQQDNNTTGEAKKKEVPINYPCNATIKTAQGSTLDVQILSDDGTTLSYKKLSNLNGPVYKIIRTNITNIEYKPTTTFTPQKNEAINENEEEEPKQEQVKPTRTYPCNATIRTKKGTIINAIVYSDNGKIVSYKLKRNPRGSTYKLSYSNIKEIKYKQ